MLLKVIVVDLRSLTILENHISVVFTLTYYLNTPLINYTIPFQRLFCKDINDLCCQVRYTDR